MIERHPDCDSRADLQHLLGLCYIHSPENVRSGVVALIRACRSGRLQTNYLNNYTVAVAELMKRKDYRFALALVRVQLRAIEKPDRSLQSGYLELLIREGKYRSALRYGHSMDNKFTKNFYAAYSYYFLGRQDLSNKASREAFRVQPLKVFRKGQGRPVRKMLVILAQGKYDFRPDISDQFSFSIFGGHFNTPVILNNLRLPHEIEYLFINSTMSENSGYWNCVIDRYDLIINAIADAENLNAELSLLNELCRGIDQEKIINLPERVLSSDRIHVYQRCHRLSGVVIPKTCLLEDADTVSLSFPVLARPKGSSTGIGLTKCESEMDLKRRFLNTTEPLICTEFMDSADVSGRYTKYRVFIIDGEIFPEHRVVSSDWNVHSSSRLELMTNDQALKKREQAFVSDMTSCLTPAHLHALSAIAGELSLDYMGVDFNIIDDDHVLVFEANAAMRINPDYVRDFAYLAEPIHRIIQAVGNLILKRQAVTQSG